MSQSPPARRRRRAAASRAERAAPPAQRRRRRREPPTLDLHIRSGFEDFLMCISQADYQRLLRFWVLGQEDVILRGPYERMEVDILLRGTSGGVMSIRASDPNRKAPKFEVVIASEVRAELLEKAGY